MGPGLWVAFTIKGVKKKDSELGPILVDHRIYFGHEHPAVILLGNLSDSTLALAFN